MAAKNIEPSVRYLISMEDLPYLRMEDGSPRIHTPPTINSNRTPPTDNFSPVSLAPTLFDTPSPVVCTGLDFGKRKKNPNRKRKETFNISIYKVLKQVHPDIGMSKRAMVVMNGFVHDTFDRIATEAGNIVKYNKMWFYWCINHNIGCHFFSSFWSLIIRLRIPACDISVFTFFVLFD